MEILKVCCKDIIAGLMKSIKSSIFTIKNPKPIVISFGLCFFDLTI